MSTMEILRERRDVATAQPMAARAVALCEGCPLAKFCATKAVAPCETPQARTQQVEISGGDFGGGSLDKPVVTSYRAQLMDDKIPFVMADLQKKKEQRPLPPTLTLRPKFMPQTKIEKPHMKSQPVVKLPVKPRTAEHREAGSADILADILMSMIGISSLSTLRDKKRV